MYVNVFPTKCYLIRASYPSKLVGNCPSLSRRLKSAKGLFGGSFHTHPASNKDLIQDLEQEGIIKSKRVKTAMMAIDRKDFTSDNGSSYIDIPLPIGKLRFSVHIIPSLVLNMVLN